MFETYKVIIEVYIKNKLIQQQAMDAPKEILMVNFMQLAEQIKNDNRPMKIRMVKEEIIWDKFENKQKNLNNEILANNSAMVMWEENNKER